MSDAAMQVKHPRQNSKTRLSYWFPPVEAADIAVPKTEIIRLDESQSLALCQALYYGASPSILDSLADQIIAAGRRLGTPFFLRTDFTSGKHEWKRTCCVTDPAKIKEHIYNLFEFSEIADIIGLPTDVWVAREMLKIEPAFYAFSGRMPITREFRLFVKDGEITHRQPYWPVHAIRTPDRDDWVSRLAAMSKLELKDREYLDAETKRANAAVPGYWSVDWLWTDRGWVLTDMAEGADSYKWDPEAENAE